MNGTLIIVLYRTRELEWLEINTALLAIATSILVLIDPVKMKVFLSSSRVALSQHFHCFS